MDWEKVSKKMRTYNWVILFILGLVSFFFADPAFTLGVIFGGLLTIANFNVLQRTICSAFTSNGVMEAKKKSIIAKYYFRLAALGFVIYILINNAFVNPIGLIIGLSIVVLSIVTIGIHRIFKQSMWETT